MRAILRRSLSGGPAQRPRLADRIGCNLEQDMLLTVVGAVTTVHGIDLTQSIEPMTAAGPMWWIRLPHP